MISNRAIWVGVLMAVNVMTFGQPKSVPELYRRGLGLQQQSKFDSALMTFRDLMPRLNAQSAKPGLWDVEKRITECESGLKLMAAPRNYIITNLGPGINSAEEEYAPAVNADETMMVFTSRRLQGNTGSQLYSDGRPYEDVWVARPEGNSWKNVKNMGRPINNAYHNSAVALSAEGNHIYLYTDENGGDILVSDFNGTQWMDSQIQSLKNAPVQSVVFASPEYFDLLAAHPELKECLALGSSVQVVLTGRILDIQPAKP